VRYLGKIHALLAVIAYSGLEFLTKSIEQIKEDVNPMLHFLGILITRMGKDNATHRRFEAKMRELQVSTKVPVLKTVIPSSDAIPGASAAQQSILEYNPALPVSAAYMDLAKELVPLLKGKRTGRPQKSPKVDRASPYKDFFRDASF
jgi:chromosome partitioning protein